MQTTRRAPPFAIPLIGYLLQLFGFHWDISWHIHLGRDSFWQPPHLAVYFGVALVLMSGALALWHARGRADASAYVLAASALLQVIAAPIDDLWHRLYGIDNTLWSFPHLIFVFGGATTVLGLVLVAQAPARRAFRLGPSFILRPSSFILPLFGLFLAGLDVALIEFQTHIPRFWFPYDFWLFPPLMIGVALLASMAAVGLTRDAWAVTKVCLVFSALMLLVNLELLAAGFVILPTVPLLLPAAPLADLLLGRPRRFPLAARAVLAGLAFAVLFYAVQYPYTRLFAGPPWLVRYIREGWLLALLLTPTATLAGLALGSGLRRLAPARGSEGRAVGVGAGVESVAASGASTGRGTGTAAGAASATSGVA